MRLDSYGENAEVLDALVRLGGAAPTTHVEHGALALTEEAHRGWSTLLGWLGQSGIPREAWLCPPDVVGVMFDKWQTHLRLAEVGVARPESWLLPPSWPALREVLPEQGRWFLKPLHGSSGSGVCAFRWHRDRMQLTAPIQLVRDSEGVQLFNSLRVRTFARPRDIGDILGDLLPAGMIGEAWLPKARVGGRELDLRVVVIAGEARHLVVRTSRHPITNLHLGNQRGDVDELVSAHGGEAVEGCRRLAERAMEAFPEALFAGVDVLLGRDGRPWVLEVNAFGDLLPGVTHRGEDTALAILRAASEGAR